MSAHMKRHHTKKEEMPFTVIIEHCGQKQKHLLPSKYLEKLETFIEKYSEDESSSIAWEELAHERIAKYKKAGLVLRGARYREGLSQKELAKRSGISQENISKMENGSRPIGEKVAKALAKALHIEESLLLIA
jgi:ribosome-binding protein aMBF1 (putative translation factor)